MAKGGLAGGRRGLVTPPLCLKTLLLMSKRALQCVYEADLDWKSRPGRGEIQRKRSHRRRLLQRLPNLPHNESDWPRQRWASGCRVLPGTPVQPVFRQAFLDVEPRVLEVEVALEAALDVAADHAPAPETHDLGALGLEELPA